MRRWRETKEGEGELKVKKPRGRYYVDNKHRTENSESHSLVSMDVHGDKHAPGTCRRLAKYGKKPHCVENKL